MRITVLVHEQDIPDARDWLFEGDTDAVLSDRILPLDRHTFELAIFRSEAKARYSLLTGLTGDATEMSLDNCSTIILIAGPHAVSSSQLVGLLRDFLHGGEPPSETNEALVVLQFVEQVEPRLQSLPSSRVFYIPSSDQQGDHTGVQLSISPGFTVHRDELVNVLAAIDENQTRNPNVGFGLLLITADSEFFLMERLREPGKGKLGTIGGSFLRGQSISNQLENVLERRFRRSSKPKVALGPLLACTSMRSDFYHYIDLTFLATTTASKASLGGVHDPELKPVTKAAVLRSDSSTRVSDSKPRYTFSFTEMARFHGDDLLFPPVENAFEALARRMIAYEASRGRHKTQRWPKLVDPDDSIEVPGFPSPQVMREVDQLMKPWSRKALPFFEGPL